MKVKQKEGRDMDHFKEFLSKIEHPDQRVRVEEVLEWVLEQFPELTPVIKWNQPMFTHQGTYIIGLSVSQKHMAVAPENAGIRKFSDEIEQAGYDYTQQLIRIPWDMPVDYSLIGKMIEFNLVDKANYDKFWR